MRKLLTTVMALICSLTGAVPAHAVIIASGDTTPGFSLTNTSPNLASTGNINFFSNVLGPSGTQVRVLASGDNNVDTEINEFYGSIAGVSSSLISGAISGATLTGVDLLVIPAPDDAFLASEISAISTFVGSGGTLFVLGEASIFVFGITGNEFINALLVGLGSGLSLGIDTFDIGPQVATGGDIAAHPLTTGVVAYEYGATASVTGGTPLFFTNTAGVAFTAVEGAGTPPPPSGVPEPGSLLLVLSAIMAYVIGVNCQSGRARTRS